MYTVPVKPLCTPHSSAHTQEAARRVQEAQEGASLPCMEAWHKVSQCTEATSTPAEREALLNELFTWLETAAADIQLDMVGKLVSLVQARPVLFMGCDNLMGLLIRAAERVAWQRPQPSGETQQHQQGGHADEQRVLLYQLFGIIGQVGQWNVTVRDLCALLGMFKHIVDRGSQQYLSPLLLAALDSMVGAGGSHTLDPRDFFQLSGQGSAIVLPQIPRWPCTKGYTLALWVCWDRDGAGSGSGGADRGQSYLYSFLTSQGHGIGLCLDPASGSLQVHVRGRGGKAQERATPLQLRPGHWHFVCVTHSKPKALFSRSSGTVEVRVDTQPAWTSELAYPALTTPLTFCAIGANTHQARAGSSFCGRLGPVSFHSRALPEAQVTALREQGAGFALRALSLEQREGFFKSLGGQLSSLFQSLAGRATDAASSREGGDDNGGDSSSGGGGGGGGSGADPRELLRGLVLLYHPLCVEEDRCIDTAISHSAQHVGLNGRLAGVRVCSLPRAEDVVHRATGGVMCLLPLFAHVESLTASPAGAGRAWKPSQSLLPAALQLAGRLLSRSPSNQDTWLRGHGFEALGHLLLQTPARHLTEHFLSSVEELLHATARLAAAAHGGGAEEGGNIDTKEHTAGDAGGEPMLPLDVASQPCLFNEALRHLLWNLPLWLREGVSFRVQAAVVHSLSVRVRRHPRYARELFGVAHLLHGLRELLAYAPLLVGLQQQQLGGAEEEEEENERSRNNKASHAAELAALRDRRELRKELLGVLSEMITRGHRRKGAISPLDLRLLCQELMCCDCPWATAELLEVLTGLLMQSSGQVYPRLMRQLRRVGPQRIKSQPLQQQPLADQPTQQQQQQQQQQSEGDSDEATQQAPLLVLSVLQRLGAHAVVQSAALRLLNRLMHYGRSEKLRPAQRLRKDGLLAAIMDTLAGHPLQPGTYRALLEVALGLPPPAQLGGVDHFFVTQLGVPLAEQVETQQQQQHQQQQQELALSLSPTAAAAAFQSLSPTAVGSPLASSLSPRNSMLALAVSGTQAPLSVTGGARIGTPTQGLVSSMPQRRLKHPEVVEVMLSLAGFKPTRVPASLVLRDLNALLVASDHNCSLLLRQATFCWQRPLLALLPWAETAPAGEEEQSALALQAIIHLLRHALLYMEAGWMHWRNTLLFLHMAARKQGISEQRFAAARRRLFVQLLDGLCAEEPQQQQQHQQQYQQQQQQHQQHQQSQLMPPPLPRAQAPPSQQKRKALSMNLAHVVDMVENVCVPSLDCERLEHCAGGALGALAQSQDLRDMPAAQLQAGDGNEEEKQGDEEADMQQQGDEEQEQVQEEQVAEDEEDEEDNSLTDSDAELDGPYGDMGAGSGSRDDDQEQQQQQQQQQEQQLKQQPGDEQEDGEEQREEPVPFSAEQRARSEQEWPLLQALLRAARHLRVPLRSLGPLRSRVAVSGNEKEIYSGMRGVRAAGPLRPVLRLLLEAAAAFCLPPSEQAAADVAGAAAGAQPAQAQQDEKQRLGMASEALDWLAVFLRQELGGGARKSTAGSQSSRKRSDSAAVIPGERKLTSSRGGSDADLPPVQFIRARADKNHFSLLVVHRLCTLRDLLTDHPAALQLVRDTLQTLVQRTAPFALVSRAQHWPSSQTTTAEQLSARVRVPLVTDSSGSGLLRVHPRFDLDFPDMPPRVREHCVRQRAMERAAAQARRQAARARWAEQQGQWPAAVQETDGRPHPDDEAAQQRDDDLRAQRGRGVLEAAVVALKQAADKVRGLEAVFTHTRALEHALLLRTWRARLRDSGLTVSRAAADLVTCAQTLCGDLTLAETVRRQQAQETRAERMRVAGVRWRRLAAALAGQGGAWGDGGSPGEDNKKDDVYWEVDPSEDLCRRRRKLQPFKEGCAHEAASRRYQEQQHLQQQQHEAALRQGLGDLSLADVSATLGGGDEDDDGNGNSLASSTDKSAGEEAEQQQQQQQQQLQTQQKADAEDDAAAAAASVGLNDDDDDDDDSYYTATASGIGSPSSRRKGGGAASTARLRRVTYATTATLVLPICTVQGRLELSAQSVRFVPSAPELADEEAAVAGRGSVAEASLGAGEGDGKQEEESQESDGCSADSSRKAAFTLPSLDRLRAEERSRTRKWPLGDLQACYRRRYQLQRTAAELFLTSGHTFFLDFGSRSTRDAALRELLRLKPPRLRAVCSLPPQQLLRREDVTSRWQRREISNFEYLMALNTISGRTYNDLNQYPVMPWVLRCWDELPHGEDGQPVDLMSVLLGGGDSPHNSAVFRDLSKPVGALNPDRLEQIVARYQSFSDPQIPAFHYGSHYSNAAIVLFFLMRLEPYASLHIELQAGKFDYSDRLFGGMAQTWRSCMTSLSCFKELTPEFYYLPEFLENVNKYDLGAKQDGTRLGDVRLPAWAVDAQDFVAIHRAALESEYVSRHLHLWIDLVFGAKQRGPAAVEAHNLFFHLTYEGAVDVKAVSDPVLLDAIRSQIALFGQTPLLLFRKPHPPRDPLPVQQRVKLDLSVSHRMAVCRRERESMEQQQQQQGQGQESHVDDDGAEDEEENNAADSPSLTRRGSYGRVHTKPALRVQLHSGDEAVIHIALLPGNRLFTVSSQCAVAAHTWIPDRPTRPDRTQRHRRPLPFTYAVAHKSCLQKASPATPAAVIVAALQSGSSTSKHQPAQLVLGNNWDSSLRVYSCHLMGGGGGGGGGGVSGSSGRSGSGASGDKSGGGGGVRAVNGDLRFDLSQSLEGHQSRVACAALAGDTLVTGSQDCSLLVWARHEQQKSRVLGAGSTNQDMLQPTPRQILRGHTRGVVSVALCAELDLCVSVGAMGRCLKHSLRTGALLKETTLPEEAEAEGHQIRQVWLVADGTLVLLSRKQRRERGDGSSGQEGGDSDSLWACSINERHWRRMQSDVPLTALSISPDCALVAVGDAAGGVTVRRLHDLSVVQRLLPLASLQKASQAVDCSSLAFSAEQKYLFAGSSAGQLFVFPVKC